VVPPKLDTKVVEVLTTDQLKQMIKACAGRELRDRATRLACGCCWKPACARRSCWRWIFPTLTSNTVW
jgi:hypothetical protein